MASLTTGSVNFAKIIYENHPTLINDLAASMLAHDIKPEIEIFDLAMLYNAAKLVADGLAEAARARAVRARHTGRAAGRSRGARVRARAARARAAGRDLDGGRHRPASADGQRVDARARRSLPHGARGQRAIRQGAARVEQRGARATRRRPRGEVRSIRCDAGRGAAHSRSARPRDGNGCHGARLLTIVLALLEYIVMGGARRPRTRQARHPRARR